MTLRPKPLLLLAGVAAAIGLSGLAGWILAVPLLKSVIPGAVEMKANTALGLAMGAGALFILGSKTTPAAQRFAQTLAALVATLGLATLGQYAFGWQLGIDELLFRDTADAYNVIRGRMSPYSTAAFASIGVALVLSPIPRMRAITVAGILVVIAIGAVSLLGYLWNAQELTTDRFVPPMALNTAVAFLALGAGTLFVTPRGMPARGRAYTRVEARVLAGFVGAIILLLGAGGYTYWMLARLVDSAQWVNHTVEVRRALSALYNKLSDAESAQRNYLLTSVSEYKDQYGALRSHLDAELNQLRQQIADNESQLQRWSELRRLVNSRVDALDRHLLLFERSDLSTVATQIARDEGIATMQSVGALVDDMDAEESVLLAAREIELSRERQGSLIAVLALLGVATAMLAALFVSIRRETTERMQAHDEANRAIAAKESFLATMSHEIRTPLNGLLGMLELLDHSTLDREQREVLSSARDSGAGLVRIIDDVLDHAKISAGKLAIRTEPASIEQIVGRAVGSYRAVASAKNLVLAESIDGRISRWVNADGLRVGQILGNFLSNAIKFTSRGSVLLRVELIGKSSAGETLCFSVKDTGIGVSAEARRRLFQPFEQATSDTSRAYGGTGLGLAICRSLAELMGGSVAMESAVGQGTTMRLTLTLAPCEAPHAAEDTASPTSLPARAPALRGKLRSVLAVDDHPTNRRLIERQLAMLGVRVRTAENGREALELWRGGGFDLVIADCNMPVMDGYALCRAIRETEAQTGGRTPFIAWTASVLGDTASRCREAGMDDLLSKPADIARLKEVLSKWIQVPGEPRATPLDPVALEKIAVDAAERTEIAREFVTQMNTDLATLRTSLDEGDLVESARVAHRLKGASRLVGAGPLAAASELIETTARHGVAPTAGHRQSLDAAAQAVRAYLETETS